MQSEMKPVESIPSSWIRPEDQDDEQCCITMENIFAAAKRIEGGIVRSSCRRSRNLSALVDCDIYLKAGQYLYSSIIVIELKTNNYK